MLRGICRSGLEYSPPDAAGSLANAGITAEDIGEIVMGWGANIVRLPFNQDWALARPDYDPERYLQALDFVIDTAAALGAYTLLDLQWLDAVTPRGRTSDGSTNFVAPLPNLLSVEVWRQLAARYAANCAVLYDIFNEPHDQLPGDEVPLLVTSGRVSMAEWQLWATCLIEAIRNENSAALIFVSGIDWGYNLRGFPIAGMDNVVYSTHIYRNKGSNWEEAFGFLAEDHAVFAGEWGGGTDDIRWGKKLVQYMRTRNIGWTAWSWKDYPRLLQPLPAPDYQATEFGLLVRGALRD